MSSRWYMLLVKPNTGKKLRAIMQRLHIWHCIPMYIRTRKVQRRIVRTEFPLFPRYVLARFDNDGKRLSVLRTNAIVSTTPLSSPRPVIHQLRYIVKAIRLEREVQAVPFAWDAGDIVRIVHGPLRGMEGRISRKGKGRTLVIDIEAFGVAAAVSLSPDDCMLLKSPTREI